MNKLEIIKGRLIFKSVIFTLVILLLGSFFYISKISFGNEKRFPKAIIIMIDGATWDVIDALIEKNKLPNMKKLMSTGSYGKLLSAPVMVSPLIWTSIATGKKSEKHGINDFLYVNWEEPTKFIPLNSSHRKTKAIWNILSEKELKVGIVGWVITWPAEEVNGFVISNRPFEKNGATYPEWLINKLRSEGYLKNEKFTMKDVQKIMGLEEDAAEEVLKICREQWKDKNIDIIDVPIMLSQYTADKFYLDCSTYLLKNFDIDFLAVGFRGTDHVGHLFWKYMVGKEDIFSSTQRERQIFGDIVDSFKDIIRNYYCWVDEAIGRILEFSGPNTNIIIVSDHGMKFDHPNIYTTAQQMNELLEILGFLKFKPGTKDIDFSQTKIYDGFYLLGKGSGRFCINVKGRHPQGIVEQEDYPILQKELKQALESIKVKGKNIFTNFIFKELNLLSEENKEGFLTGDIKLNFRADLLKDSKIEIQGKIYEGNSFIKENIISGSHDKFGILIWKGPNVKKNNRDDRYCYLDIIPTLLYALNQPIAEDMDGEIMLRLFAREFLDKMPITSISSYDNQGILSIDRPTESTTDDLIIKRLKSLGYIQ